MRRLFVSVLCLTIFNALALEYPNTRVINQQDDYHGTLVADPYRWLEDDVRESAAVADWVKRENQLSFGYLEQLPDRQRIHQRLKALWNYPRFGIAPPRHEDYFLLRKGERYFSFRNDGLQNQ